MIAGRYTLDREIGRGGMGAVWLARDEVLGRDVAIKRIGAAPGGTSPDFERAEREARLAARLNHPHVVAVFDLVTEEDERWLVMEYVAGVTLAELVRRDGALTPDEASPLVGQAADALAAAHAAGIVHRDVKPSNILVTSDGQVKLSDFGIARAEADASLTQTGLVTGSPAYLAPEVASGEQATAASDVWSLGATLYHALDGRPPYEVGDNLMGALYRIVHEEPPRLANAGLAGAAAGADHDPGPRRALVDGAGARLPARRPDGHDHPPLADSGDGAAGGPAGGTTRRRAVGDRGVRPPRDSAPGRRPGAAGGARTPAATGERPDPGGARRRPAARHHRLGVVASRGPDEAADDTPPRRQQPASQSPSESVVDAPTADGMEGFMEDYLATAPSDPATAFEMLTPDFQAASGGLEGYRGFWDTIETADLTAFSADPEALTVAYTVEYQKARRAATVTDDVGLALVFQDGTYKIAGES